MERIIHELIQGTPEWHAHRHAHFNASEAPAMLGVSEYQTRSDLIHVKATGSERDVSAAQQARFDDGHAFEATARPWAAEIIGDDLYPITASLEIGGLPLSASYDGATADEEVIFEHKSLNQALRDSLPRGEIPDQYKPQMEQQLLILGAKRCLFMASNGDRTTMLHAWYEPDVAARARLLAGWTQFKADLAAYVPQEVIPAAVAAPVKDLPAIIYKLDGLRLTSNLTEFKSAAQLLVEDSKKPLESDQDFADRERLCKAFSETEKKLTLIKEQVVGEIKDVDAFCRDLSEIGELVRQARLNGEKQVSARKEAIRLEIQVKGKEAFAAHVVTLNERLGKPYMPAVPVDFAGVMKGKKTISSLRDAVDTELARAKIEANRIADGIQVNLNMLRERAKDHAFLFADTAQIVLKAADDCAALVTLRIQEHQVKEAARLEAERERIRQEEAAKLVVAAVTRAPSPRPASNVVPMTKPKDPPTDNEIIEALMSVFIERRETVVEWLCNMNLSLQLKEPA